MKFTRLKNLLVAVVCLFAGVQAQAQFQGSVEQYPTSGYESLPISFKLSEVASALETDESTLATALQTYIAAEAPDPLLFSLVVNGEDVAWTDATKANGNGFWMTVDGQPTAWGEESAFFFTPAVETEEGKGDVNEDTQVDVADISSVLTVMASSETDPKADVNGDGEVDVADISTILTIMAGGSAGGNLVFYVGQMPDVMQGGETAKATVKLTFNGKSTTFDIALNVKAKPVYNVPEPTLLENQLNIVGEQECIVEQYPRGGYDTDAVTVELTNVGTLLGIPDMHLLEDQIASVLYTTWYNDGDVESGGGLKKDSLTNTPTGEGYGFWYHAVQNAEGIEDGEVAATGWGGTDKFFMNNFTYDVEAGTLTCQLGQYPGVLKDNEEWFAYVYLIYGEKAYRIKYTLKVMEKEQGSGLAAYTKVGEAVAKVEQEPTDDYSVVSVRPDMEAIASALGCEVSAIGMVALDDKDNFGNSTANNGGFWFSDAGTVVAWGGSAAMFIEPLNSGDYSVLSVGQYPGHFAIGDEASASIYFMNGDNYYQYTVNLKIVEPTLVEHGFQSVATRAAMIQAVPSGSEYPIDAKFDISLDDIEALIGTRTPELYGLNNDSVASLKGLYSKAHSCDPKPGFWLDKDGYVTVWADANSRVGICYANGQFQFFQYPNRNSVGDNFKSTLFLVNEETEKMITINFTVSFVDRIVPIEIVGSENITLPVDNVQVKFDVEKACDALFISVDELLNPNNYYFRGLTTEGIFGEAQNADNGLSFDLNGGYDGLGDIYFTIEQDGDDVIFNIAPFGEVEDDFSVDAQFCIEVNDQRYIYYVKFVSPALYE